MKKAVCLWILITIFTLCPTIISTAYAGYVDPESSDLPDEIIEVFSNWLDWEDNNDDDPDSTANTEEDVKDLFRYYGDVDYNWAVFIKEFQSTDPIDIVFGVGNSEGTSEYLIAEALINNTEETWTDYHVQLGVGTGDDFRSLAELDALDVGLDFDYPDMFATPLSFSVQREGIDFPDDGDEDLEEVVFTPVFLSVDHGIDYIEWYNGEIAPHGGDEIDEENFHTLPIVTYSIDIPDIPEGEGYEFTLRQYPTFREPDKPSEGTNPIPEPSSLALLGFGLLGAALSRKKK